MRDRSKLQFTIRSLVVCSCLAAPMVAESVRRPLEVPPASSGETTLVLSDGVYSVPASMTIPRRVHLQVSEGATIAVASGAKLTVQGGITAGSYRIFSGLGFVSFSGNRSISTVDAKWWGASGDGTTNDTALLQAALVASTTAANRLAFYIPASTYRVCNLFLGNPDSPGCPTKAECPAPARVYGDGGTNIYHARLKATDSCGANRQDFVVLANSTSSFTLEDLAIDGNATSTPGSGVSCVDVSWKAFVAPATKNIYRDLDLEGCKDERGAYGLKAHQLNDAAFENVFFGYRSKKPTGLPMALSLLAEGGQAGTIRNIKIYGAAPLQIDVQNGQIQDSYLTGGLVIGFSGDTGGVSTNHLVLNNVQIDQNIATGIVINGLKPTPSTAAVQDLVCNACTLSTIGLSPGEAIFSGAWLAGASINGGLVNAGRGTVFGPHFARGSGNSPFFFFRNTVLNGALPTAGPNREIVLEGAFEAKKGVILNSNSHKPGD